MASFYGWGSTASRLEPLQGGSLLFIYISRKTILSAFQYFLFHKKSICTSQIIALLLTPYMILLANFCTIFPMFIQIFNQT